MRENTPSDYNTPSHKHDCNWHELPNKPGTLRAMYEKRYTVYRTILYGTETSIVARTPAIAARLILHFMMCPQCYVRYIHSLRTRLIREGYIHSMPDNN